MSINKLISINNPIIDAMSNLGIDNREPAFYNWATQAEKNIRSFFQYEKKRAVLTIEDCHVDLPDDAINIQRAVLGDLGCDCADLFNSMCSTIQMSSATLNSTSYSPFMIVDMGPGYSMINGSIPHTIQDNRIILNSNLNGLKLTLQYIGFKTDENGLLMVSQNHTNAITDYICWKFLARKGSKIAGMEYGIMKDYKDDYHRHVRDARAMDAELTESERAEIVAMLNDPLAGQGLPLGVFDIYI